MDLGTAFKAVNIDPESLVLSEEELTLLEDNEGEASEKRGAALFEKYACKGCHFLDAGVKGKYGPALVAVYGSTRHFTDEISAVADGDYLRESILDSNKKIVRGYG